MTAIVYSEAGPRWQLRTGHRLRAKVRAAHGASNWPRDSGGINIQDFPKTYSKMKQLLGPLADSARIGDMGLGPILSYRDPAHLEEILQALRSDGVEVSITFTDRARFDAKKEHLRAHGFDCSEEFKAGQEGDVIFTNGGGHIDGFFGPSKKGGFDLCLLLQGNPFSRSSSRLCDKIVEVFVANGSELFPPIPTSDEPPIWERLVATVLLFWVPVAAGVGIGMLAWLCGLPEFWAGLLGTAVGGTVM